MANPRLCSIPDCGKPARSRGWCLAHYKRWKRHGNPKAGRIPNGAALEFFQTVVLPYKGDDCLLWPYANVKGYGILRLNGRNNLVTRLICEHRHGPAPSGEHEAAHICGNGHLGCANGAHLEWKTHAENMTDMIAHGTSARGERNGHAKLSGSDISKIRALGGTMTQQDIADIFNVHQAHISIILSGKTWRADT